MPELIHKPDHGLVENALTSPRDVADFHLRWPDFRAIATATAEREDLSSHEREVVRWLIRLADRVGRQDLT
jgi:hypothetical protein